MRIFIERNCFVPYLREIFHLVLQILSNDVVLSYSSKYNNPAKLVH